MSENELQALTALVAVQAAEINGHVTKYGELQYDPWTEERKALTAELKRRGIFDRSDSGSR